MPDRAHESEFWPMLKRAVQAILRRAGVQVYRIRPPVPPPPIDPRVPALLKTLWPVRTAVPLIRAGGDGDGAYLVPDDLDGIAALFSPGVDQVSRFEGDMAARGMTCYLADASVAGPAEANPAFRFVPKYLGLANDADTVTLDAWVEANEPGDHDLMLQMDIEGAEWVVLANASDRLLSRFRVMVIEFHELARLDEVLALCVMPAVLGRLTRTHHVVHSHANNCVPLVERGGTMLADIVELTFLRKDRAEAQGHATEFPHPLDVVNVPHLPQVTLPEGWHG